MKKLLLLLIGLALFFSVNAFAMTITPMDNVNNLAQSLVGSGVTISNITYTGANVASGYFTGGTAAGIGINNGIVLTSGYASNLNGTSNTSDAITGDNGLGGNAQLDALIPGFTTYDATVLGFDFTVAGTPGAAASVYFNYVFGSDEYNEYVNSSYNDVFGFFFNGSNVALIPGTSTAVSINNINNGAHSTYYNDNDPSDTSVPYAFEYDGFTDVFTASITGLAVGQTYHIDLAIADAGDYVLDSGVFIQGSSFSDEPHGIPEPATMLLLGLGLMGVIGMRRKIKK